MTSPCIAELLCLPSVLAKNTTQLHFIEALLLDTPPPTGTISEQLPLMYLMSMTICVCVYAHTKYIVAALASVSQVGMLACTVKPEVCSWPKGATKFQKCPAELSNHSKKCLTAWLSCYCWMMKAHQMSLTA